MPYSSFAISKVITLPTIVIAIVVTLFLLSEAIVKRFPLFFAITAPLRAFKNDNYWSNNWKSDNYMGSNSEKCNISITVNQNLFSHFGGTNNIFAECTLHLFLKRCCY